MKYAVNVCLKTTETISWCQTVTNINDILLDFDGISDAWFISKKHFRDNEYLLEYCVAAETMPIPSNLMKTLKSSFPVSQVNVTRYNWYSKKEEQFQWINDGITAYSDGTVTHNDVWDLFDGDYCILSVYYIPTLTKDWTEVNRRKKFEEATFCFVTSVASGFNLLDSTSLEDALKETERAYIDMMKQRIVDQEARLQKLQDTLKNFKTWTTE